MLLAVPVSLCDNQEPATLSMFATAPLNPLSLFSPVFFSSFLSLCVSQDEGPQHLISTSAVKVQRLLALLHIMKEGWSLDPPGKPLKDWVTERRIPELSGFFVCLFFFLVFLRKCLFFSSFALASVEEDFLQRPTFCCCFLDMMEKKKNLYRLIMLKACILTQDIDKHTENKPNIHISKMLHLKKKKRKKKLCTCINKCKCQHKN